MTLPSADRFPIPEQAHDGSVWVERSGTREFIGYNQRGVQIPIGHGEGRINPGELLKLALIGCAGMSMDLAVGRRIGEDFDARLWVHDTSDPDTNSYPRIHEQIQIAAEGISDEDLLAVKRFIDKAIHVGCTVERSVGPGVTVTHELLAQDGSTALESSRAESTSDVHKDEEGNS